MIRSDKMKKVLLLILLIMTPFFVFAYPYGDVDGSNKVDIRDYGLIMGHITGNKKLVGDELKRADIMDMLKYQYQLM